MENYCRAQTPLTYQYGSSQYDTSLMFIQNNFEWSYQTTPSTDTQSIFQHSSYNTNTDEFNSFAFDQSCLELNSFNNVDSNNDNSNNKNDIQTSPLTAGYFDCFTENSPIQEEEVYELNLDDSLKNVLNEIESIPSVFLEDISFSSPSSVSSTHDQEILSPGFDLSLWSSVPVSTCGSPFTCNFNVPDLDVSSGESEVCFDDARKQLRKVNNNNNKSGRVNKRESNKVAAVRYRQRKAKERDQLFQECELYGKKNEDLKEKISDLEQQIGFIKSFLMQALAQKK